MTKKILAFLAQSLTWCFLLSMVMASIEALAYFASKGVKLEMPFQQFQINFANTCAFWLATTTLIWLLLSFFMVWLGGVRLGLALFFMLAFLALFGYLAAVLDVLFTHDPKYAPQWAAIMRIFGLFALATSTLCSLILAKLFRRFRPIHIGPHTFMALAVVLVGMAFAVWARYAGLPQTNFDQFWWVFTGIALVIAFLIWMLGRYRAGLAVLLATLAVALLHPLPVAVLAAKQPVATMTNAAPQDRPVKHVLLITVDTLRCNALGVYDADAKNSPQLDQLARESATFTNAFSVAPWTYPSVTSFLTGLAPAVHQLWDEKRVLPEKVSTLAESMRDAGYATAAFGFNGMLLPRSGLNRGFQEYHWHPQDNLAFQNFGAGLTHSMLLLAGNHKPDATELTSQALEWMKAHERDDYFLWLHYFSPHMPYYPPAPYQPTDPALKARGAEFMDTRGARLGSVVRSAEERAWVRALYDGEVRFVDTEIGRVLELLKTQGHYENALIAFTADHGEELWDHDRFEHGHTLYNELVRVPLLLKRPGPQGTVQSDVAVSTRALMPTILELCSIPQPVAGVLLPSLAPLLDMQAAPYTAQPAYIGATLFHDRLEGVVFDGMKYIRGTLSGHEQLFNLTLDPGERMDLAGQDTANLERGRQLLEAGKAADARVTEQLGLEQVEGGINQEAVRAMEAMGYL